MTPEELDYLPFDADNHYYEALDAFTRHVPAEMQPRVVQWVEQDGRKYHLVGGRISHAVVNPTWDPVAMPGALHEYFKGNPQGRSPLEMRSDFASAYRSIPATVWKKGCASREGWVG